MSHLFIAENILNNIPIKNIPQYYLGTLAPDAVHFRKEYDRNQKRTSHLYINLDKSDLENYVNNWRNNVVNFFEKHKMKNDIYDFLIGYCIHLFVDINTYKNVWKPFEIKFKNQCGNNYTKIYQEEHLSVDFEIFQNNQYEKRIFPKMKMAKSFDFMDLISEEDMEGLKDNILNRQYKKEVKKSFTNKYITYEKNLEYNKQIIEIVNKEIREIMG